MKINFLKKLLTNKKLCDMMYLQKIEREKA